MNNPFILWVIFYFTKRTYVCIILLQGVIEMMYFDYDKEPRAEILCIDCKSFYASCECVARGLPPLTTMLVVLSGADRAGGLVLAASPEAKRVLGVSNVTRRYELPDHPKLLKVPPRMSMYIDMNLKIIDVVRRFVADEDIYVYSIDEMFVRCDKVLKLYGMNAKQLALKIMQEILKETGIYTTSGIGDNMLLAKLALDNEAKHNPDMVAEWRYEDVQTKVWGIKDITDFWGIGHRTALRLERKGIRTVKELANYNPFYLKDSMGVMGAQLHAHANGIDRSTIDEVYKPVEKSISNSQILLRDYTRKEDVEVIIKEMSDLIASRLRKIHAQTESVSLFIGYASEEYERGFHKRMKIPPTSNTKTITNHMLSLFNANYSKYSAVRQVGVGCGKLVYSTNVQLDLFQDPDEQIKQEKLDFLVDEVRNKYGFGTLIHASSLLEGATGLERSKKIGGH